MQKNCFFIIFIFSISLFAQDNSGVLNSAYRTRLITKSEKQRVNYNASESLAKKNSGESDLTWHDWLTNIPKDYSKFYQVAIHTDYPVYLGIAASTIAFMATDNKTWPTQNEWYKGSNIVRQLSDRFGEIGDGRTQFALTGIFVGFGLIFKDDRALRTGSQILQVTISAGAFVQVLKHITGRESPVVSTQPAGEWKFFPSPLDYHRRVPAYDAYPSGHLTTMLGMIGVISENYPEWKWVKPVGYSIAGLMAFGMVNNGIHWYSDYPLAIFLGYEFGKIVAHPENYNKPLENEVSITVHPYRSFTGTGVALSLVF